MFKKKLRSIAAISAFVPMILAGAAGEAAAGTSLPTLKTDAVRHQTSKGTVTCFGSPSKGNLNCQTTKSWGEVDNIPANGVSFNLVTAKGSNVNGNYDIQNTTVSSLKEGKKYNLKGMVVLGKNGKFYFSSPKYKTRGELTPTSWRILETS
ncbi:hypothetical protein GP475_00535 [Corynebacterium poyangense]|uniref:Uncharacterized protein n=1 Tax=Corynebacterium poyangense TaxID=2684405 RepID=A0A7H0SL59_9CORY|nr:hypothetical protein [Corynebacterium poyangense]MBZ8177370.1 hypothetical protein [Corynebacterium poyangense]QNQ89284.1 hypothetical protein GP475_00535 [Corynebacterium poyangense]